MIIIWSAKPYSSISQLERNCLRHWFPQASTWGNYIKTYNNEVMAAFNRCFAEAYWYNHSINYDNCYHIVDNRGLWIRLVFANHGVQKRVMHIVSWCTQGIALQWSSNSLIGKPKCFGLHRLFSSKPIEVFEEFQIQWFSWKLITSATTNNC